MVTPAIFQASRERIHKLRAHADALEAALIEAALVASGWYVARAAALLGMPRTSLQRILDRRLPALGERMRAAHAAAGYTTGKPPSLIK